jgi:hypothetical protein
LASVEAIAAASNPDELATRLVRCVHDQFAADWAALLRAFDSAMLAAAGSGAPKASVLAALAAGTAASPAVAAGDAGPGDLAVATLGTHGAVLLVGRAGHPFRRRERRQLLALARIADRVVEMLPG